MSDLNTAQRKPLRILVNLSLPVRHSYTSKDRFADRAEQVCGHESHTSSPSILDKKVFVLVYLYKQPCPLIVELSSGGG